jgi:hypothetical protein
LEKTWASHEEVDLGSTGVIPANRKKTFRESCAVFELGIDAAIAAFY